MWPAAVQPHPRTRGTAEARTSHACLLARVGTLYHVHGRTQREIADETRASRPTVSRLLREARETGIVRISVSPPPGLAIALESELEERFGLAAVRVVGSAAGAPPAWRRRDVGAAAAADL